MIIMPVEARYTEYIHSKAARAGIPLNGTFEITPCCNMNCRMCYVRMSVEQQRAIAPLHTAAEWLELGRIAKEHGMLYLLVTGGEPFLHPEIRQILEGLHQMGLIISINSNGTMIDEKTIEWLKKCPPVRINITLYGASDETYGRLCRNPRGFTQVTKAIRLLTEAGITVKLNCSVTPYNCMDLDGIFGFAEEHGLHIQGTSYMFPPVRRDESMIGHNDRFTPDEAAYQSARIEALTYGAENFLKKMELHAPMALSGDLGDDCDLPDVGDGVRCRAGKCSFWVTWEGKMMPCGMFPQTDAPNVFREGFDRTWELVREKVRAVRLPPKCAGCALKDECKSCAAMVYTETGTFDQVPKYRCDMAMAYAPACRKLEAELRAKQEESK